MIPHVKGHDLLCLGHDLFFSRLGWGHGLLILSLPSYLFGQLFYRLNFIVILTVYMEICPTDIKCWTVGYANSVHSLYVGELLTAWSGANHCDEWWQPLTTWHNSDIYQLKLTTEFNVISNLNKDIKNCAVRSSIIHVYIL